MSVQILMFTFICLVTTILPELEDTFILLSIISFKYSRSYYILFTQQLSITSKLQISKLHPINQFIYSPF